MIAAFFDGQTARLHQVELETTPDGIVVAGTGIARLYTAAQAQMAEPFENAPAVVYFPDGTRCEVSGAARGALADALGYRTSRVVRLQAYWVAAVAALMLLLALLGAAAFWGVPAAAELIAQRVPATVDQRIGQSVLAGMEKKHILFPSTLPAQSIAEVEDVARNMLPQHPRVPIRVKVYFSPQLGENALALPDGTIVITDQMVQLILGKQKSFGDEERAMLAGVLAHEIGHIEHRHSTRVLARTSLTAALSATLFGDFSAVAAGAPALLVNMRYSREMETDADSYAIEALQAKGISLQPLANLFQELDELPAAVQARGLPAWLTQTMAYASTHPATAERIARLRRAAAASAADAGNRAPAPRP